MTPACPSALRQTDPLLCVACLWGERFDPGRSGTGHEAPLALRGSAIEVPSATPVLRQPRRNAACRCSFIVAHGCPESKRTGGM